MKDKDPNSIEVLLKHPEVQVATNKINRELIERRKYSPPNAPYLKAHTFC